MGTDSSQGLGMFLGTAYLSPVCLRGGYFLGRSVRGHSGKPLALPSVSKMSHNCISHHYFEVLHVCDLLLSAVQLLHSPVPPHSRLNCFNPANNNDLHISGLLYHRSQTHFANINELGLPTPCKPDGSGLFFLLQLWGN